MPPDRGRAMPPLPVKTPRRAPPLGPPVGFPGVAVLHSESPDAVFCAFEAAVAARPKPAAAAQSATDWSSETAVSPQVKFSPQLPLCTPLKESSGSVGPRTLSEGSALLSLSERVNRGQVVEDSVAVMATSGAVAFLGLLGIGKVPSRPPSFSIPLGKFGAVVPVEEPAQGKDGWCEGRRLLSALARGSEKEVQTEATSLGTPVKMQLPAGLAGAFNIGLEGGQGTRLEDFEDFDECGKGTCASVFKVRHKEQPSVFYALKRIPLLDSAATADQTEYRERIIMRELAVLHAKHTADHIVQIHDAFKSEKYVFFLLEYMHWSLERILKTASGVPFATLRGMKDRYLKPPPLSRHLKHRVPEAVPEAAWSSPASGIAYSLSSSSSSSSSFWPLQSRPRNKNTRGWKNRSSPMPERVIACFTYQILCGLQQLHALVYNGTNRGIVHKDLKPDNILMNDKGQVKIADFGCCAFVNSEGMVPWTPFNAGTKVYMSPERVLRGDWMGLGEATDGAFAQSADVWALGITTLELACGCHPCDELLMKSKNGRGGDFLYQAQLRYESLLQPVSEYRMSDEFTDFTVRALAFDPRDRPSSQRLLGHPWFKQHNAAHKVRNMQLKRWVDAVFAHQETSARAERDRARRQQSKSLTVIAGRRRGVGAQVWSGHKFRSPPRDSPPTLDPSEWPLPG
eukprot:Hpha_TRINITY_DN15897_c0_g2::TRINITY_DN15897_c0_g2_i1::g.187294::m.187294